MFRINLSHTALDELAENINLIKSNSDVPICLDSQGAQIRTGNFKEKDLLLDTGEIYSLGLTSETSSIGRIPIYPEESLFCLNLVKSNSLTNVAEFKNGNKSVLNKVSGTCESETLGAIFT